MRNQAVHVIGLASTEGAATVRFLHAEGFTRITVHDMLDGQALEEAFKRLHVGIKRDARDALWLELESIPFERRLGPRYLEDVMSADRIFAGQAWRLYGANFPALGRAFAAGIPFHSVTELCFALSRAPITAVTGSVGKSTTSRLVQAMLDSSGVRTVFGGNERRSVQVLGDLRMLAPTDRMVLEVSNRQLIDLVLAPTVGLVTNVAPNHLEEHGGSFERYASVKRNLVAGQSAGQFAVINADDPGSAGIADGLASDIWRFSTAGRVERGVWLDGGRMRLESGSTQVDLGPAESSRLPGAHNVANILAAATAAHLSGATSDGIRAGLRSFVPPRHRLELVRRARGVEYYDDLNSSNPTATIAAFRALDRPIVWIAGGEEKGLSLTELVHEAVRACRLLLLLPGAGSESLARALETEPVATDFGGPTEGTGLSTSGLQVKRLDGFADAVAHAVAAARPGDAVLLSPAFPGFFSRHYTAESGFRSLLRELAQDGPETETAQSASHLEETT
jgi:UDP-N-acetylmuramoylalanine--D-glutamate ligase